MTEVLKVAGVSKRIGTKEIIKEASFSVAAGQVVGLLGPNGAGKTTLIRMIVGLMKHDKGTIEILGKSLEQEFKGAVQHVGAIVENPEFYNYMSGYDNLMQYARMARSTITAAQLDQVVRKVHLENNIKQKVKTYSLGMRQRLGVAQALLHEPQLLVLDEPMNGLDPKGMKEFRETILSLRDNGVGILVSSHQLSDMEQLCDHLVVVQKGAITHTGPMKQEQETIKVLLETDNNSQALKILSPLVANILQNGNHLQLELVADNRSELVKQLVANEIGVKEIKIQAETLEDNFLRWTEEGGL